MPPSTVHSEQLRDAVEQRRPPASASGKVLLRRLVGIVQIPLDLTFAVLAVPCALLMLAYRKIGSTRMKMTTKLLKRMGVFPIRDHYYEPLFQESKLRRPLSEDRELPGIDLNEAFQLELLEGLDRAWEVEAMGWNGPAAETDAFRFGNGSFESGDAEFLYQFLRWLKPGKMIEIGSGHSTKVARVALERNRESGAEAQQSCIEPYEMGWLESLGGVEVIRKRLEDCEIDWGRALDPGDLLFIDSSHMIRPQGDVLKEYLEILPRLASGVYVHIHDVFTPKDYPLSWLEENVFFWNEQYLMEAVLSNQSRYEVVAALNYLRHRHYNALQQVCPYLTPQREPGSFYLRVR